MNDRQDNLYAAPVSQTEEAAMSTALYLDWSRKRIGRGAAICGAVSALFVLAFRIECRAPPPITYFSDAE